MSLHLAVRVAGHLHGHGLHLRQNARGCVARCGCKRWGRWRPDRRQARASYIAHLRECKP